MWRVDDGSQGLVRQSSRNVALRVEEPSVLNKFFFQNYNILPRSGARAESLHQKYAKFRHFLAHLFLVMLKLQPVV